MKLNVQKQQLALTDDGSIWDQIIKRIVCNEITINVLAATPYMQGVERQQQQKNVRIVFEEKKN